MTENTRDSKSDPIILESRLTSLRRTPIRLAFGFLSGGPLLWFLIFICLPLATLAGALLLDSRIASVAVGLSALFLLGFWWTSYRYASPKLTIDPSRRTVRIEHGRTPAWTRAKTVDLDELETVLVVPFGDFALVRLNYRERNLFRPWDFLLSQSDVSAAEGALRESGVGVAKIDGREVSRLRTFEPPIRVVLTPLVLVAIPAYAVWEFGTAALQSDIVIIAVLIATWTFQAHITDAVGLRPQRRSFALLFDVVATLAVLIGVFWIYLQLP